MNDPGELVELRGGLTVPASVIALGCDLERRGIRLTVDGEKLRVSGPEGKPDLTPEDVAGITRYKLHLMALVEYRAP